MNIRTPQSGNAARIAKAYLATLGLELKHSQALELIARLHGYTDNQAMQADAAFQDPIALRADSCTEFTMTTAKQSSVWVTVENISVCIKKDDEGVTVDLFAKGQEGSESMTGTWALYQDAVKACRKCGSPLDEQDFCTDSSCAYHDWDQAVTVEDMQRMSQSQLESKYGTQKRERTGSGRVPFKLVRDDLSIYD